MFTRHRARVDDADVERDDDVERVEETTSRHVWSPAQLVGAAIGIAAIVFGAVALTTTGLNTDTLFHPHDTVAGYGHTPLLAIVEILFGVVMLLAAMTPGGRSMIALLSACVLGFGIVVVADAWQARLHHWLGVGDRNGWLFVIVGAVGLFAATMIPTVITGGRTHVHHVRRAG